MGEIFAGIQCICAIIEFRLHTIHGYTHLLSAEEYYSADPDYKKSKIHVLKNSCSDSFLAFTLTASPCARVCSASSTDFISADDCSLTLRPPKEGEKGIIVASSRNYCENKGNIYHNENDAQKSPHSLQ